MPLNRLRGIVFFDVTFDRFRAARTLGESVQKSSMFRADSGAPPRKNRRMPRVRLLTHPKDHDDHD